MMCVTERMQPKDVKVGGGGGTDLSTSRNEHISRNMLRSGTNGLDNVLTEAGTFLEILETCSDLPPPPLFYVQQNVMYKI